MSKARTRSVFTHLCTSYENFLNLRSKHNYNFNDMSETDFLVAREIAQNLQDIMSIKYEAEKETIAALERVERCFADIQSSG